MLGIDAAGFALDISAPPLDCFGNLYGKNVNLGTKKTMYRPGCTIHIRVSQKTFCRILQCSWDHS